MVPNKHAMDLRNLLEHVVAVIVAALLPALIFCAQARRWDLMTLSFCFALAHVILLGVPGYALLGGRAKLTSIKAVGIGLLMGAIPIGLLTLKPHVATVCGGFGAAGGFGFWAALRLTGTVGRRFG
jgi:hypothetical protein